MMVRRLELFHYRSYAHLTIEFNEKMNIILGENGSGKTNLVEAIHYLSLARSFRTNDDALLIQKNQPFAKIKATIAYQQTTKDVEIILSNEGKRVLMNHKQIQKLSQLSQVINVIIFEPKDVLIFDDFPKVRRKFIDIAISKHTPAYLDQITKYEQILKERNALLKYINPDRRHLTLLTQRLVEQSLPIVQARADYLRQINEVIAKIFTAIKGEKSTIELRYVPYVDLNSNFLEKAQQLMDQNMETDMKRKTTQFGVHREDFVVIYDQNKIASYGSQGENRLASIALKLSPYFLVQDKDLKPVIVLDDVLSELDEKTQLRLIEFLEKMNQVFITSTHYPKRDVETYVIKDNQVTRRKN